MIKVFIFYLILFVLIITSCISEKRQSREDIAYKGWGTCDIRDHNLLSCLRDNSNKVGKRCLIRMPVTIYFKDSHMLEIERSILNSITPVIISLDDSGMGIDLLTHLRGMCSEKVCKVWVEGYWGSLLNISESDEENGTHPFAVFKVYKTSPFNDSNENVFYNND